MPEPVPHFDDGGHEPQPSDEKAIIAREARVISLVYGVGRAFTDADHIVMRESSTRDYQAYRARKDLEAAS